MEAFHPKQLFLDQRLTGVQTPLKAEEWGMLLQDHMDQNFVSYLIRGMKFSFRISFNRVSVIQPSKRNMRSVADHAAIISEYIQQELERGFVLGPFDPQGFGCLAIQLARLASFRRNTHRESGGW